jgi:hypothetical protein
MEILVPEEYRKTREEIANMWAYMHNIEITSEILLMIDYAYYHEDPNYGDGLSFLDRLYNKLSNYFELNWDLDLIKNTIRNAPNPPAAFEHMLFIMLDEDMIECYGV